MSTCATLLRTSYQRRPLRSASCYNINIMISRPCRSVYCQPRSHRTPPRLTPPHPREPRRMLVRGAAREPPLCAARLASPFITNTQNTRSAEVYTRSGTVPRHGAARAETHWPTTTVATPTHARAARVFLEMQMFYERFRCNLS